MREHGLEDEVKNQEPRPVRNQEPRTKNQNYTYRNLVLWQKAQEFALAVIRAVSTLPDDTAAPIIARQVIRSASSISANIAEGHGRFSIPAHKNHLSIAKASACESDSWIDLLLRAGFISGETEASLHVACEEIVRMLTAKIIRLERMAAEDAKGGRMREESPPYLAEDYVPAEPGSRF